MKTNQLIVYGEITVVCSEIPTKTQIHSVVCTVSGVEPGGMSNIHYDFKDSGLLGISVGPGSNLE